MDVGGWQKEKGTKLSDRSVWSVSFERTKADTSVFVESTDRRCGVVLIRQGSDRLIGSADVFYVQFNAYVISDVETKISGRRREISEPERERW